MKRDFIIITEIFQKLLSLPYSDEEKPVEINLEDYEEAAINYHIKILKDFDMIKTMPNEKGRELPSRIMWRGHEYIDSSYRTILGEGIRLIRMIT